MPEAEAPVLSVLSLGSHQCQTCSGPARIRVRGDYPRECGSHQHVTAQDGGFLCRAAHGKQSECVCVGGWGVGGWGCMCVCLRARVYTYMCVYVCVCVCDLQHIY